jgi:hypothetical protein
MGQELKLYFVTEYHWQRNVVSYKLETKLRGFSPQANYTDRETAAFGKSNANFCGYSVSRGQRNGSPLPLISVF